MVRLPGSKGGFPGSLRRKREVKGGALANHRCFAAAAVGNRRGLPPKPPAHRESKNRPWQRSGRPEGMLRGAARTAGNRRIADIRPPVGVGSLTHRLPPQGRRGSAPKASGGGGSGTLCRAHAGQRILRNHERGEDGQRTLPGRLFSRCPPHRKPLGNGGRASFFTDCYFLSFPFCAV